MNISWKSFVSGIVMGSALFSGISYAAPSVVKLMVDGKEIRSDVSPQKIDGRVMVPARFLAEALGAKVEWDDAHQTVIVDSETYRKRLKETSPFTEQQAVSLGGTAQDHYWHVMGGGTMAPGVMKTFQVDGRDFPYRWLGSDINTKEKYTAYLEEVYTPEQAADFVKRQLEAGSLVEIDKVLAQPNADGGGLLIWNRSQATLKIDTAGQKTFLFAVPDGVEGFQTRSVLFRYVEGKGWRVDEAVGSIR